MTTPAQTADTPTGSAFVGRLKALEFQEYALAVVVVALFVAGAILKPDTFPTWANVRNMLTQASVVGVLAIGMTFVIATAGIDLSVGSMVAAAGVFGGILVDPDSTSTLLFIAGAVLDQSDAGGLGGKQVWLYGTILTGAYMISRGLAKSGSRDPYTESDDEGHGNRR